MKKKYNFRLLVDDAHGFGTLGKTGAGAGEEQGCQDGIDIYFSTFAKSMANIGAFVAADKDIIDYISSRSVLRLKRVAVRHMIHELTLELKEEKNEEALMEKMKIIMELKKVSNIINERLGIVIG